jgi:hypothetical protein
MGSDQTPNLHQDQELNERMDVVRHAPLHNLAANVLGVVFKRHVEVLLGRDLRFGGHLWEA